MGIKLSDASVKKVLGNSRVAEEFRVKVEELTRRLRANGIDYTRWDTLNDNHQTAFSEDMFLDPTSAESLEDYVNDAVQSCWCPDVVEDLHDHSPALIEAIEEEQENQEPEIKVVVGEGLQYLDNLIEEMLDKRLLLQEITKEDFLSQAIRKIDNRLNNYIVDQARVKFSEEFKEKIRTKVMADLERSASEDLESLDRFHGDESPEVRRLMSSASARASKALEDAIARAESDLKQQAASSIATQTRIRRQRDHEADPTTVSSRIKVDDLFSFRAYFSKLEATALSKMSVDPEKAGTISGLRWELLDALVNKEVPLHFILQQKSPVTGESEDVYLPLVIDKNYVYNPSDAVGSRDSGPPPEDAAATARLGGQKMPSFGEILKSLSELIKDPNLAGANIQPGIKTFKDKEMFPESIENAAKAIQIFQFYRRGYNIRLPINVKESEAVIKAHLEDRAKEKEPYLAGVAEYLTFGEDGIQIPSWVKLSDARKTARIGGGAVTTKGEITLINFVEGRLGKLKSDLGLSPSAPVPFEVVSTKGFKVKIPGVVGLTKTVGYKGDPKSDLSLRGEPTDPNDPETATELLFISHKEGSAANDVQQWGGISEPQVQALPETAEFIDALKANLEPIAPDYGRIKGAPQPGDPALASRKLEGDKKEIKKTHSLKDGQQPPFGYYPALNPAFVKVALQSLFGMEFVSAKGDLNFGPGNKNLCDAVIQGGIDLNISGKKIIMGADAHLVFRNEMKGMNAVEAYEYLFGKDGPFGPEYAPAYLTKGDQGRNDAGLGGRITLMPAANRKPRTVLVKKGNQLVWEPRSKDNWPV